MIIDLGVSEMKKLLINPEELNNIIEEAYLVILIIKIRCFTVTAALTVRRSEPNEYLLI